MMSNQKPWKNEWSNQSNIAIVNKKNGAKIVSDIFSGNILFLEKKEHLHYGTKQHIRVKHTFIYIVYIVN